ncbi:MAG TPA: GNAT family N-acetyltransferase [Polyangiaceae bacterium]
MALTTVERADPGDLVAMAQCMAIDADTFPHASARFGTNAESARVWIARDRDEGRVLGFLAGRVGGAQLHVEGLAVEVGARRRGTGRGLLRACVDGSRDEGLARVTLHVSVTSLAAVRLYESEGFEVVRELPGFYPERAFGGETRALAMHLRLDPGTRA